MGIQRMAAAAVVAGLALTTVIAPDAAGAARPVKTIESSTQLPGNAIRREHILLERSLDDLDTYLRIASSSVTDLGKSDRKGGTVLKHAMKAHGLEWRDSSEALPRWRIAYLLNPEARVGIDSLRTRIRVAEHIERIVAQDEAFADGTRNGKLSARSITQLRAWVKLGRKFAGSFETYYPLP